MIQHLIFCEGYKQSVVQYIKFLPANAENEPNPTAHAAALEDVRKTADTFRSLIDEKISSTTCHKR